MAELVFFTGTMDCGKSTLAAQMNYTHASRGRRGLVFTCQDRAGQGVLSTRLGLEVPAIEVNSDLNFFELALSHQNDAEPLAFFICDEAQFYSRSQIDQLAHVVDDLDIDVFAFGITADFRAELFPGSARLIELADRIQVLQVEALCWCGQKGTHNARTVNGVMVTEGDQVMVGDTSGIGSSGSGSSGIESSEVDVIGYEVLCRRHFMASQPLGEN